MMNGYRCAICSGVRPWYTSSVRFWYTSLAAPIGGAVAAYRKDGGARATVTTSAPMWRATALLCRGPAAGWGTIMRWGLTLPFGAVLRPQRRDIRGALERVRA